MARAVYPYELTDPDFSWLISCFMENFPEYKVVDQTSLPMVFIGERLLDCDDLSDDFIVIDTSGSE